MCEPEYVNCRIRSCIVGERGRSTTEGTPLEQSNAKNLNSEITILYCEDLLMYKNLFLIIFMFLAIVEWGRIVILAS